MNITEALNVALPDLPARSLRRRFPRLHPQIVTRQHLENGQPVIYAIVSGANQLYRLTARQWQLIQLFDGTRSYEDVSRLFKERAGVYYSPSDIHNFVSELDEIWYSSPQSNVTATQKEAEERHRHTKKWEDVTTITVGHWDPNNYLTRLHDKARFIYTRWFTFLTLASFVLMGCIFIARWSEIGTDTWNYYNFTQKGFSDIAEFWLLFCFLGFFHESAHGLTCKHFGGQVHKMGFLLFYLEPCFFVDVTEVYVYAGKWARIATCIAGIWVELIFCVVATVAWCGTPVGMPVHDFAYKIILITGVGVAAINLNPLIKLDGYYILCELVGIVGLKEDSTAFVSSWVKKYIFRLPVEVEFVRQRLRWVLTVYALLSGVYSYTLLYLFVRFCYNVFSRFSPEWAFVPACIVGGLIFRSRIRMLLRFMKVLYLDKKETLRRWFTSPLALLAGALALLFLFLPVWPETRTGRFSLEPIRRASIRATVPGEIMTVVPEEDEFVAAGTPLVHMRNLDLEGKAARTSSELQTASLRATQARIHYTDYARAERERDALQQQSTELTLELGALHLVSPIAGVVTTPRVRDSVRSYVQAGDPLLEVADVTVLRARIYLPEFDMRGVEVGDQVSLKLDSAFRSRISTVAALAPAASATEAGLSPPEKYLGMTGAGFYAATALMPNAERSLRPGMSGTAKILIARRSLVGLCGKTIRDFVDRTVW